MKQEQNVTEKSRKKFIVKIIILLTIFICSILLYSRYIGTRGLLIKEYKIVNDKITSNFHGLKIVHISDIHYGRTTNIHELNKLEKKINMLKPDIIVLTGDLIDKDTKPTETISKDITDFLTNIKASIGKYAITGEDDLKIKNWNIIIEKSNFKNLNDTYEQIYKNGNNFILLSGMSSEITKNKTIEEKLKPSVDFISSLTEEEQKSIYKILIMHEPDSIENINAMDYDLILAGHSHNGQVNLPIIGPIILPENAKNYYKEHYKINNTELYISSGIGTTDISFRLFNKPSINFYRITNK